MEQQHQDQLTDYVAQQLQAGLSPNAIQSQLITAGWQPDHINQAFQAVQARVVVGVPSAAAATSLATATPGSLPLSGARPGRLKMGWALLVQSATILNGNRYLLRYLLMTWLLTVLVNGVFIGFIWFVDERLFDNDVFWYSFVFTSYLVVYFIINFYAAALSANIFDIFKGQRQSYGHYLQKARSKIVPIFVYSLISAIVGTILQYLIERLGWIGRLIIRAIGIVWALATMFVLPIIMDTDASAVSAIKQSMGLLKQTWGEGLTAKITVNLPIFLINVALCLGFVATVILLSAWGAAEVLIIPVLLLFIFFLVSVAAVGSYANAIINMALYYYAVNRQVPPGFDETMLNQVIVKK